MCWTGRETSKKILCSPTLRLEVVGLAGLPLSGSLPKSFFIIKKSHSCLGGC